LLGGVVLSSALEGLVTGDTLLFGLFALNEVTYSSNNNNNNNSRNFFYIWLMRNSRRSKENEFL
jgi:hypothetical protein